MTQTSYYRIVPILLAALVLQVCVGKGAKLTVLGAKEHEKPAADMQVVAVTRCPESATQDSSGHLLGGMQQPEGGTKARTAAKARAAAPAATTPFAPTSPRLTAQPTPYSSVAT